MSKIMILFFFEICFTVLSFYAIYIVIINIIYLARPPLVNRFSDTYNLCEVGKEKLKFSEMKIW